MTDETRDDLRDLLAAGDPAASLPPADPARVARLLEETMSEQPDTQPETQTGSLTDESRTDGTHGRSRLTWLVAAAAVLVIAAGIGFVLTGRGGEDVPDTAVPGTGSSSAPEAQEPSQEASVTRLTYDATAAPARCAVPSRRVVEQQDLAFDGVVRSIAGDLVTLEPSRFYAGEETDLVTVREPSRDLQQLLTAVDFTEGERYLVSATDDRVSLCGISAPWTAELEGLYAAAFPA